MAKSESNKFQKKNAWLDQPYTSKLVVVAAVHTRTEFTPLGGTAT